MRTRLFRAALLFILIPAGLASCINKVSDSTPSYERGGNSIVVANDDNLIIAGYNSATNKGFDANLVKVNATTGDTIWSKSFGGSYSDAFFNVQKSNTGGYIATGFTNSSNGGSPSMLVVITDEAGKAVKTNSSYGGNGYTEGFSIVSNSDSGYLVAGFIQKTSTSDRDLYLVRIDDDGTLIWDKNLGATSTNQYDTVNDAAYGVIAAPGGGYFVTGSINGGYNMEGGRIFLMKVNASGNRIWTKTYGTGFGYALTLTNDGNVAVSGSILSGTNQDVFLFKTDTAGKLLWSAPAIKTFGGAGFEYGASLVEMAGGGFAITGITESSGFGVQDAYLVKTDALGAKIWEKTFGGSDIDQGYGLIQTREHDLYVTGLSNSDGSFIFLNRVDENGNQKTGWPKYLH